MYDKLETPCFIIDKHKLEENVQALIRSLDKYWKNYIVGYSVKTNSLPWILNYMKNNNIYLEVVSDEEYELSESVGVENNRIIFNGPCKGYEKFKEAILNDSIVNIDSLREIIWLEKLDFQKKICVGIRCNYNIEAECPNETSFGELGSRFGFNYENGELEKAINRINAIKNVKINGIHIHCTTLTRSVEAYESIAKKTCEFKKYFKYDLDYIDIGGGYFGGVPNKPTFDEYFKAITNILINEYNPSKTKLIVEPGSAFIASPINYLCTVIDVKNVFNNRIITTDATRNNIDPFYKKDNYLFNVYTENQNVLLEQILVGYTCLEYDRILTIREEKELSLGDKVLFEKVGAYSLTLSPLFIKYFPTVYLYDDNKFEIVRKKWSVANFIQNDLIKN